MTKSAVVIINGAKGSELQDIQALIQVLLHAHRDQPEGAIMAVPPLSEQPYESEQILDAYAAAYPELQTQLSDLPLPAELYSVLARDGVGRLEVGTWSDPAVGPLVPDKLPLQEEEPLVVLNWQAAPELTRAIQQHPAAKGRIRALDLKPRHPNELLPDDSGRQRQGEALLDPRGANDPDAARASPAALRQSEAGLHPNDPMAVRTAAADLESLDPIGDQEQLGTESAAPVPSASLRSAIQEAGVLEVGGRSGGTLIQPSLDARLESQASDPRTVPGDPATSDPPVSSQPEPVRQDDGTVPPKPGAEPPPSDQAQAAPAELASEGPESGTRLPLDPKVSEPAKSAFTEQDDEAGPGLEGTATALPSPEGREATNETESGIADLVYPARTVIGLDWEAYPLPAADSSFGAIFELLDLLDANVDSSDLGEAESMLANAFRIEELEPEAFDGAPIARSTALISWDNDARAGADPPSPAEGEPPEDPPLAWPHLDS